MVGIDEQLICASEDLAEGGDGVRFTVRYQGIEIPAFALRYRQHVHAYLNRCTHRDTQLDWVPGRFLDADKRFLICATHGAVYEPETGKCAGGPCRGGLVKLSIIEKNNAVYFISSNTTEPVGDKR